MKILIQILYTESWKDIADAVLPNYQKYCDKNGYELVAIQQSGSYNGFDKIKYILQLFKNGCDICWSLDCDTMVTNHNIKIEDFISEDYDAYFTKDYNGLNCGSFIIRRCAWAEEFMCSVLALEGEDGIYCEQDAILAHFNRGLNTEYNRIKFLPQSTINSYKYELYPEIPPQTHEQGQWQEGDFVLHLPGLGMEQRLNILKNTKVTE
jgi:hypothetical protein